MIKGKWTSYGLIFKPNSNLKWMKSHAQLPTILRLSEKVSRIYFASRNKKQISHIGYFDFDLENKKVINYTKNPILFPGKIGNFDADGVYPSSIIEINNKIFLYFIGWNKGEKPPLFYAGIGLAISSDGGYTFEKLSCAPILSRSNYDPCLVTAPNVFWELDKLKMIYTSGLEWKVDLTGKLVSYYHLKEALSEDGIKWIRNGKVAVELEKKERDISRSDIISFKNGTKVLMYGVNTSQNPYRIKFSLKNNKGNWIRNDNIIKKIHLSKKGFDSRLMSYPSCLWYKEELYMFYNGNNFGKEGVGLRVFNNISYEG